MDNNEAVTEVTENNEEPTSENVTEVTENNVETPSENVGGNTVSGYTFYDEFGNVITLEVADNSEEIQLLTSQLEQLQALNENQAEILTELQLSNDNLELALQGLNVETKKLEEINRYSAYTFAILLAFVLYRIISGALSSIFGGG